MNKRLKYLFITCTCLSLCSACDEGKIYPDDTIDSGRTATVTLHFTHLDAWPQKNSMSLISLGEDGVTPILVKRIPGTIQRSGSRDCDIKQLNRKHAQYCRSSCYVRYVFGTCLSVIPR